MDAKKSQSKRAIILSYSGSLLGAVLFVIGINVIIVPHQLYSGTLTGVAQIIESFIVTHTPLEMPQGYNLMGTALLLLNIPLLIMVLRVTDGKFPLKSIITIVFLSVVMSFVPIPYEPFVTDPLTATIVGGVIAGFGSGLTLRCGGSGGGSDLIGLYCSVKYPNFTVGRVVLIIGLFVYGYGLIMYDLNTVIYSAIFTTVYAVTIDHAHHQNIKTQALIFTVNPDAIQSIMDELGRGVTCWEGKGAYSGQHTHIFVTVISKYEAPRLKRIVSDADPKAYIILNSKVDVVGNFIKRF
ncbi:MAG: YitT family protein [Defluviitaleaceae bacterium]|nr:YitT family protein [Defluviitaleaceae bacterium]